MAGFGKKKALTEYLYTKPVILLLLVAIVLLSIAVYKRYTVERLMSVRRTDTEEKRHELIERKKVLEEKVEYLSGDRGIEEEIRTHFDVAKEGEKVIILVGEDEVVDTEPIAPVEKEPWYIFWR